MTLVVTETKTVTREDFESAGVEKRTMLLYDFVDQRFTSLEAKVETALSKNGNGDCLSLTVGKGKLKIPMTAESLKRITKAATVGTLVILMLTGQINIESPLAKDLIAGLARLVIGG